jgi:hypothetical protein
LYETPAATEAPEEETVATVSGPTIRDFFLEILESRGAQEAVDALDESLESDLASMESEGSLDILFSDVATDESDHSAAMSLAQAFGNEQEADDSAALRGTPAHQAADELSLDHVFRAATPAKGGGAVGAFSLDQFFAGEMPDAETSANSSEGSGPGGASGGGGGGGGGPRTNEDIAQFNAWLNGLKKT